jgi:fructokinase
MNAKREADLLVIGESLVDIVRRPGGAVSHAPGGSPANVALALGRLGRKPLLVTALGDDDGGRAVREWLAGSDVEVQPTPIPRTATATADLDDAGSATYEFDLDWRISAPETADVGVVHTGSIACQLEPGAAEVLRVVQQLQPRALVTFDPNIRPALLPDRSASTANVEAFVRLADVVKASDEDVRWLYPDAALEAVAEAWLKLGPALVIITRGEEGALGVARSGAVTIPTPRTAVVDTVGAGDTFMAGVLDGLVTRGLVDARSRDALRAIRQDDVDTLLRWSARAAAITVSRLGADPPRREELLSITAHT